jgi:hypothetical protein
VIQFLSSAAVSKTKLIKFLSAAAIILAFPHANSNNELLSVKQKFPPECREKNWKNGRQ